jgi:hypothetical protein
LPAGSAAGSASNTKGALEATPARVSDGGVKPPTGGTNWLVILSICGVLGVGVVTFWVRKRQNSARHRYRGIPTDGAFFDEDEDEDIWGSGSRDNQGYAGSSTRRRVRSASSERDILVDTADFDDDDFGDDFDDDLDLELRS